MAWTRRCSSLSVVARRLRRLLCVRGARWWRSAGTTDGSSRIVRGFGVGCRGTLGGALAGTATQKKCGRRESCSPVGTAASTSTRCLADDRARAPETTGRVGVCPRRARTQVRLGLVREVAAASRLPGEVACHRRQNEHLGALAQRGLSVNPSDFYKPARTARHALALNGSRGCTRRGSSHPAAKVAA